MLLNSGAMPRDLLVGAVSPWMSAIGLAFASLASLPQNALAQSAPQCPQGTRPDPVRPICLIVPTPEDEIDDYDPADPVIVIDN
jgi:hypothetical protein